MKRYKAGNYIKKHEYKSFSPSYINREFDIADKKISVLLENAGRLLGELNAFSRSVPDIDFYIFMLVAKEATVSSRIEGTKTLIDEAVMPEEEILPERKDDWQEVRNYIIAINSAVDSLKDLPLCIRLIKETHKTLLRSVRGEKKIPGEIRTSQNWIGGSSPSNAFFVPPVPEEVSELLADLEKFWHNDNLDLPKLIKIAISHYQFETIHPFLDGNGRIGRLLVILQLIDSGILRKPAFYLSEFFEENKKLYYDSLTLVREKNDLEQWIRFFLQGVCQTAEKTIQTFEKIDLLRKENEEKIYTLGRRAKKGYELLRLLYSHVYINVDIVAKELKISWPSANKLISEFVRLGILKEITNQKQYRKFVFDDYIKIFRIC
ncbi:MAG: cell filamentation protein Fic [Candidatus Melainabacteria bacterium RIFOXYA12_FULL_32_12]|nr:MAG: cell filamentation protein Fic [Candidatus Melainabacteria bacterium RIFOXYA2_FULL_32_9]OGI30022.1 MAG: cell filamentation protein Fic [Candidatus Melainabacteria bacterium RIFOXYA12_FULL_32_12]